MAFALPPRRALLLVAIAIALSIAGAITLLERNPNEREESAGTEDTRTSVAATASGPAATSVPSIRGEAADALADLFAPDDPAWAWSRVDLDALRDEMPDNAFWTLAAPTDDPAVLAQRREARDVQNREWGRILSNTAQEADVRAFYAERQRESSDLVTFTTRLLDEYGSVLPDRDRGLVELSRRMHRQRLEELPRRLQEALDRRAAHADAVAAWKADQAAFGETDSPSDASE
ncbi:MAG: hypothetical protein NXI30_09840 [bacterium]|nr:hypothetical protein [bacterium]